MDAIFGKSTQNPQDSQSKTPSSPQTVSSPLGQKENPMLEGSSPSQASKSHAPQYGQVPTVLSQKQEGEGKGRYSESEIEAIISNLKGDGFKNNPLRQAYETEVRNLSSIAEGMKQKILKGEVEESEVAKELHKMRRDLGVKYKNATPSPLIDYIYAINIERYGDPLGPTYEMLRGKGKTDAQIIESSYRPNPDVDVLLGGFEKWLREQ